APWAEAVAAPPLRSTYAPADTAAPVATTPLMKVRRDSDRSTFDLRSSISMVRSPLKDYQGLARLTGNSDPQREPRHLDLRRPGTLPAGEERFHIEQMGCEAGEPGSPPTPLSDGTPYSDAQRPPDG